MLFDNVFGYWFGMDAKLPARRPRVGKHGKGRAPVCRKKQRKAKQRRRQANKALWRRQGVR